jgi:hypothetical protein
MTTGLVGWMPSSFVSEKVPDDNDNAFGVQYDEIEVSD